MAKNIFHATKCSQAAKAVFQKSGEGAGHMAFQLPAAPAALNTKKPGRTQIKKLF